MSLEHVQSRTLSDHDPVLLTICIVAPPCRDMSPRKTTYFKANPNILKLDGTLATLQAAWESHVVSEDHPSPRFAYAWTRLRSSYKDSQEAKKNSVDTLDQLLAQLIQLKLDMVDETLPEQREEFQELREKSREAEHVEANRLCRISKVRWMGVDDKPTRMLFRLVKEKQLRESMNLLITEIDTILEDEDDILQEVQNFYTSLCTTTGPSTKVDDAR